MAISSIDMNKALTNENYAAQCIRSGKLTANQRGQIAAQWGNAKIVQWESVDNTKYEISNDEKEIAKEKGDDKVNEATGGFDGESDGTASATMGTVNVVGGACGTVMGVVTAITQLFSHGKYVSNPFTSAIIGAILLANSIMLKSLAPNKDQAQACDDLKDTMQDSQDELADQQEKLSEITNDIIDSTDELAKASEEANQETKTKQAAYERLQREYKAIQDKNNASKSGGDPLTDSERSRYNELSGILGTQYAELKQVKVDGDAAIAEAKEVLEEKQDIYDDAAMKMEEVQEITDFQAEFDEATVDNAAYVKTSAKIGVLGAVGVVASGVQGVATAGLNIAQHIAGAAAIATGAASGIILTGVVSDQSDYQSRAEAGVENRQNTEKVNVDTNDLYEEELDNYAGSVDFTNEIELTETTAVETQIVALTTAAQSQDDGKTQLQKPKFGSLTAYSNGGEDKPIAQEAAKTDKKEEII